MIEVERMKYPLLTLIEVYERGDVEPICAMEVGEQTTLAEVLREIERVAGPGQYSVQVVSQHETAPKANLLTRLASKLGLL